MGGTFTRDGHGGEVVASADLNERAFKSRVRRPKDKSPLLEALTAPDGVFPTYRECLVFAAALGFHRRSRKPFEVSDEQIAWSTFESYEGLFNLLAVSETGDADVVDRSRFGEQLTIFEEYANGGLEIISNALADGKTQSDTLAKLVTDAVLQPAPPEGSVESIMAALIGDTV